MYSYLSFSLAPTNTDLRQEFLKDLGSSTNSSLKLLHKIIKNETTIRVKVHESQLNNVFLVMISCSIDKVLMNLGHKHMFPRGFPIIWIPKTRVKLFGFYPKFDNDDQQSPDQPGDFHNIQQISFFKKWSGFLGQLCVFKHDNQIYWTCCSKNSADANSEFVLDAKRLFEPSLNKECIKYLVDTQYHLCAEMISKKNQTHGARTLNETPIITSIGKGVDVLLSEKKSCPSTQNPFVDFLAHEEVVRICQKYKLPCDSAITLQGDHATVFMTELSSNRDFMTNTSLDTLVQRHYDALVKTEGTRTHCNVSGDVLEGLVIKIQYNNNTTVTKKYKFPNYTVRTMALRTAIHEYQINGLVQRIPELLSFPNRWCVSAEGKTYWETYLRAAAYTLRVQSFDDDLIQPHILVCDYLNELFQKDPEQLQHLSQLYEDCLHNNTVATVIVTLGPIGAGKSTVSERLATDIPNGVHIDGDRLSLNEKDVGLLKSERNDFTIWLIIKAIMEKKIPILSCGGGVLSSFKKTTIVLRERISAVLGINIKVITLVPEENDIPQIQPYNGDWHAVEKVYNDKTIPQNAIEQRIRDGTWTLPSQYKQEAAFYDALCSRSVENARFAKALIINADTVFTYSIVRSFPYTELFGTTNVANAVIHQPNKVPTTGTFMQHRLLVKLPAPFNYYHHITIAYDATRNIQIKHNEFEQIDHHLKSQYDGSVVTYPKGVCFVVVDGLDQIVTDGLAHVTIKSGKHEAALMRTLTHGIRQNKTVTLDPNSVFEPSKASCKPFIVHVICSFGI